MKRIFITLMVCIVCTIAMYAQEPSATINSVWLEHNVTHTFTSNQTFWNGYTWVSMPQNVPYKGMKIHVNFDVEHSQRQKTWVCVFFYDENENPLRAKSNSFRAPDGSLTVQYPVNPQYEYTTFNDVWLFMPYSEFNVNANRGETVSLKLIVNVMDKNGYSLDFSDWEYFDLTK